LYTGSERRPRADSETLSLNQRRKQLKRNDMENNLGYIAVGLFIVLSVILLLIPKKTFAKRFNKDFGISESEFSTRKDNISYYRALFLVSGLATIVIMLLIKYVIL
jgi:uncharacterized membrane protein YidH (DUF202 family)